MLVIDQFAAPAAQLLLPRRRRDWPALRPMQLLSSLATVAGGALVVGGAPVWAPG